MTKRFGFTLAEVLITLTIIGVIAAMTIPTLMSNTSDQEYKTGLKKAISTLNQAITMQYALEGTNMSDFTTNTASGTAAGGLFGTGGVIKELFQQRMQVVSTTDARNGNAAIYLSDGMVIEFPFDTAYNGTQGQGKGMSTTCVDDKYDANTNSAGCLYTIVVDVNGDKGNCNVGTDTTYNSEGKVRPKDCFPINVYAEGVRPANFVGREIMYSGK